MEMRLKGKTAVVTGAGGRIGLAICSRLAAEGAAVVCADLSSENAEKAAATIRSAGGCALPCRMDVTRSEEVRLMVETALRNFGSVEILINNAGGSAGLFHQLSRFENTTEEIWRRIIDLNLNGTLSCIHALLKQMIQRRYGKIINMSSVAAEKGLFDRVDYAAAKGGILSLTRALALEVGQYNINVNCISPGMITGQTALPHRGTWLGRSGEPREIAALAAFLASDDSSFITGENHTIDGGRVLGVHTHSRNEKQISAINSIQPEKKQ